MQDQSCNRTTTLLSALRIDNNPYVKGGYFITKAPREGASFITSQCELGVIGGEGGGGGGWPKLVGLFGYPTSGAGKNPVATLRVLL